MHHSMGWFRHFAKWAKLTFTGQVGGHWLAKCLAHFLQGAGTVGRPSSSDTLSTEHVTGGGSRLGSANMIEWTKMHTSLSG